MENTKTYIKEISEDILDLYFPQIDSLSLLIHDDPKRASRIIVNIIKRTLDEFENYAPLTAISEITLDKEGCYAFKNNYLDVFEGRETIENLELVPLTIARVGGGMNRSSLSLSANYWKYNPPVLKGARTSSVLRVDAIYHYPIVVNYTEDGYLHRESHIFGFDENTKRMFFNLIELRILERIKSNYKRISLSTSLNFMELEDDISSLKEKVEEDKGSSSVMRLSWR